MVLVYLVLCVRVRVRVEVSVCIAGLYSCERTAIADLSPKLFQATLLRLRSCSELLGGSAQRAEVLDGGVSEAQSGRREDKWKRFAFSRVDRDSTC